MNTSLKTYLYPLSYAVMNWTLAAIFGGMIWRNKDKWGWVINFSKGNILQKEIK